MKLSSKIIKYFSICVFITLILTAFTTSLAFKKAMDSYLEAQTNEQFEQISRDIASLNTAFGGLTSIQLGNYAQDKKLNIKVMDAQGRVIASFNGVRSQDDQNEKMVTRQIKMLDYKDQFVGTIEFSYLENLFTYNQSVQSFYTSTIKTYGFIMAFAILLGSLLSYLFAKRISQPITEMNDKTKRIISSDYDLNFPKYDIYELDELSNNLEYLNQALQAQDQYRQDYAQDIAHELRTPLTNLLLHLEGIRDEIIDADPATISNLVGEVNRLNKMVENLHSSFARTNKLVEVNLEEVDISAVLEAIISSFGPLFDERSLVVKKDIPEAMTLTTDKDKFTQIINNLITNACKASNEGQEISISAKDYGDRATVIIKDSGTGISPKDLDHIFERFYRVDSARNRKNGGHGLGLSIVKTFVDLIGGDIKVNSQVGKGSEFILTLKK